MSLSIADRLNQPMTRKQFLQMSGALVLAMLGIQNLVSIFQRHTIVPGTAPSSLLEQSGSGFGSRKFGM